MLISREEKKNCSIIFLPSIRRNYIFNRVFSSNEHDAYIIFTGHKYIILYYILYMKYALFEFYILNIINVNRHHNIHTPSYI